MAPPAMRRCPALAVGDLLPSFTLRATDGKELRRVDFKGRVHLVLLFLDAPDCARCRRLLARLSELHDALWDEQARVLAIVPASRRAGLNDAPPFPLLPDDGRVAARYGVIGNTGEPLAALFVADRYGEVVLASIAADRNAPAPCHGFPVDRVLPVVELLQVSCDL